MKKIAIAALTAASVLVLSACNNGGDSETVVETSAGNITKDEFYNAMKDRFGEDVLVELVHGKVLGEKYEVTDEDVDKEIKNLTEQYGPQFEYVISQQGEDVVKEMVRVDLLRQKAAQEEAKVSEEDLKNYIKASHILVADEKTAKEVKDKLNKGGKFEDLAKEYSTDGTKDLGGDLGWFTKEAMIPEFSDVAFSMKKDEISDPVKSQYGYHIIKVTDKYDPKGENKELKEFVKNQQASNPQVMQSAIDKAIADADVKVNLEDYQDVFKPAETEQAKDNKETKEEK